jgi:hypothetical protein
MDIILKATDFSPFCKHSVVSLIWGLSLCVHVYLYCLQASKGCFKSVTHTNPISVLASSEADF